MIRKLGYSAIAKVFRKRGALVLALLVAQFVFLPSAMAHENALRSASELDYPPFCIVTEGGEADGYSVRLLEAALRAIDHKVSFRVGPWSQIKEDLAEGRIDVLPFVGRTAEREPLYDFSFPYITMHGAIFVRKNDDRIRDAQDLAGKHVIVMRGDNAEEYALRTKLTSNLVSVISYEEAFKLLSQGKHDAVVAQRLMGGQLLKRLGIKNIKVSGPPLPGFRQDFCFAVREGDSELLELVSVGLAAVMGNGTDRRLRSIWLGDVDAGMMSERTLVIGGDRNFPPFEYIDEDGRPSGYNTEVTRALARAVGISVRIELGRWDSMLERLENGEVDALQGTFYSADRDRSIDFSIPHQVVHYAVFARTNSPAYTSPADLEGHRVAVEYKDEVHEFTLRSDLEAELVLAADQPTAMSMLAEGEADFALVARLTGQEWISTNDSYDIVVAGGHYHCPEYCYAVRKGNGRVLSVLDEGLALIRESGELRRIREKWFGREESGHVPWRGVFLWGGIAAAVILLSGLVAITWIRLLRRAVALRTREAEEARKAALNLLKDAESARAELAESEAKHMRAQQVAHIGHWELDSYESAPKWSDEVFRIFGLEPGADEPSFTDHDTIVHPEDWPSLQEAIRSGFRDGSPFDMIFRICKTNGGIGWMRAIGEAEKDSRGRVVKMIGTAQEVTLLKEAQRALEKANVRYRETVRGGNIGLWEWDLATNKVYFSPEWKAQIGYEEDEIEDDFKEWESRVHPEDLPKTLDTVEKAIAECRDDYETEFRFRHKDGSWRWIAARGSVLTDDAGQPVRVVGSHVDVTERVRIESERSERMEQAERSRLALLSILEDVRAKEQELDKSREDLRRLAGRLESIREDERSSLAREIHDNLAQVLTALLMDVSWLKERVGEEGREITDKLSGMEQLVDEGVNTVHRVTMNLRPAMLDDLGLISALDYHIEEFAERAKIDVKWEKEPDDDWELESRRATAIFRIVQEALTNIARYAEAQHVSIKLQLRPKEVFLEIRDDGIGIKEEDKRKATSLGLVSMRERALAFGGSFHIHGKEGEGTVLTVTVPLGDARA